MQHAATVAEREPAWLPRFGEHCGGIRDPTGYSTPTLVPHLFSCLPATVSDLPWPPGGLLLEGGKYLSRWGPAVSASGALSVEVLMFLPGIVGVMGVAVTLGPGSSVWFWDPKGSQWCQCGIVLHTWTPPVRYTTDPSLQETMGVPKTSSSLSFQI